MIRSPGCQPLVSLSRSSQPVGTPVTCTLRSKSFWMLSKVGLSSSRMVVKPWRIRWSVIPKMRASAWSSSEAVSSWPA